MHLRLAIAALRAQRRWWKLWTHKRIDRAIALANYILEA